MNHIGNIFKSKHLKESVTLFYVNKGEAFFNFNIVLLITELFKFDNMYLCQQILYLWYQHTNELVTDVDNCTQK